MNFSGKSYTFHSYGVDRASGLIDYDAMRDLARKHKPALIVAGGSAYPRRIDFPRFRAAADEVGARLMVDIAHIAGLVVTGLHPSPIGHAQYVTTTTHKTLRGPRGGMILAEEAFGPVLDSQIFPGIQGGPLMHVIAAKAVALGEALRPEFKRYQRRVLENAATLASELANAGHTLVSGGTDTHLMLVDLSARPITGKEAETALDKAGITVNKNTVPFETRSPFVTSGIRLGTPALTTRGMGPGDMRKIAAWIVECLESHTNETRLAAIAAKVEKFASRFPLFAW